MTWPSGAAPWSLCVQWGRPWHWRPGQEGRKSRGWVLHPSATLSETMVGCRLEDQKNWTPSSFAPGCVWHWYRHARCEEYVGADPRLFDCSKSLWKDPVWVPTGHGLTFEGQYFHRHLSAVADSISTLSDKESVGLKKRRYTRAVHKMWFTACESDKWLYIGGNDVCRRNWLIFPALAGVVLCWESLVRSFTYELLNMVGVCQALL